MMDVDESLAKFNLEDYDDEDDEMAAELPQEDVLDLFMTGMKGLTPDAEQEDPYLIKDPVEEDEEEDKDDLKIRPSDSLLVTCRTEDQISYLEVNLYEDDEQDASTADSAGNHYVHHDIMLPTFPLCVEVISFPFHDPSNENSFGCYAAVGTFDPEIEIWNLDVLDVAYPQAILGKKPEEKTKKKAGKKAKKNSEYHTDAIMSLSWNKCHRNMLLSGSADSTVKLWDLASAKCLRSFEHHSDKVQAVQWCPAEPTRFISGSYDRTLVTFDCRTPAEAIKWDSLLKSDPECIKWNPHRPTAFVVGEENGLVHHMDLRKPDTPVFSLQAHSSATTCVDWHPTITDCLLTASADKSFKIWKCTNDSPSCILSREPEVGKLFTTSFCPDSSFLISVAGSRGDLRFFNLAKNQTIMEAFAA